MFHLWPFLQQQRALIILAGFTAVMLGFLFAVKPESLSRGSRASGSRVGIISVHSNDVRQKSSRELVWSAVVPKSEIFNRDRIFTGENSRAVIQLESGASLVVNPNSLVVISVEQERESDDSSQGLGRFLSLLGRVNPVRAKVDPPIEPDTPTGTEIAGAPPEGFSENQVSGLVASADEPFREKNSEQAAETPASAIEILVGSAELHVEADEPPKILAENSVVSVSKKTVTVEEIKPVSVSNLEPVSAIPIDIKPMPALPAKISEPEPSVEVQIATPLETPEPVVERQLAQAEPQEVPPLLIAQPRPEPPSNSAKEIKALIEQPAIPVPLAPAVVPLMADKTPEPKPVAPVEPKKEEWNIEAWLWVGTGMNFQFYSQSVPELGETRFQNLTGPTVLVRGGFMGDHFGLDVSYKDTPGEMQSSSSVVITNGDYRWQTMSSEILLRESKTSLWKYRVGFQHHKMPFMVRDPFFTIINVETNTLTMLSLGVDRVFPLTDRFRTEWQMRYQHPLVSGSSNGAKFEVEPQMSFDGSVGGVLSTGKNSRAGVYWYGQLHKYRFDYSGGGVNFAGNQTLFYSNVELRLGLEF